MLSLIVLSALALQVGVFAEDDNTLALVCMNLPIFLRFLLLLLFLLLPGAVTINTPYFFLRMLNNLSFGNIILLQL